MQYGIKPPTYRLPDATRVGRVALQVADLERSLAYYQRVLGLNAIEASGDRATLGAQGSDVPLVELRERKGARPVPRGGLLGLYHYAVLLPDRAALGRFIRHLATLGERAGMSDHFVSEAVYLQDPDNLGIEVYADRPRSAWRVADRQLAMSTIPLDVRSVVDAAGDEPWRGAPPGTTVGHVHLHVGDIEEAEAFYHRGIGLDKVVWSYPGALFMSAGGYHHHLGTNTWAGGAPSASERDARMLEWELVLPERSDVDAAFESVQAQGHAAERNGVSAVVRDPWGTQLRLRT